MEEPRTKYILLHDRVGHTLERIMLSLGLTTKSTPTQVLRGELLEAVREIEQPRDLNRIALVGIERKSLHLECRTEDLTRLADEDANLLFAISSSESRYLTFMDSKRLTFGRQLLPGSAVFVKVTGISKDLPGIVRYKGELPPMLGTWFGVELTENPGFGTNDGTFRNRPYFTCAPDSGVFVGLDKLTPQEDAADLKSQKPTKKDENTRANLKWRLKDFMPSFWKGKTEQKSSRGKLDGEVLKIGERVVTFIEDYPVRGTVRYIGEEKDLRGRKITFVGLEMDERVGTGTGIRNGYQLFVCRRDFAGFVPIENVTPEKDFDAQNPDELYTRSVSCVDVPSARILRRTKSMNSAAAELIVAAGESSKTDTLEFIEEQRQMFIELKSKNLSDHQDKDVVMQDEDRTGDSKFYVPTVAGSALRQSSTCKEEVRHSEQGVGGNNRPILTAEVVSSSSSSSSSSDSEIMEEKSLLNQPSEPLHTEAQTAVLQSENLAADRKTENQQQLREMGSQLTCLQEQLREKNEQEMNLQRRLREMEQQMTRFQAQLREKESEKAILRRENLQQEENLLRQLREMEQQLTNVQEQLKEKDGQLREMTQQVTNVEEQLQEKDEQLVNSDEQLQKMEEQLTSVQGQLREKDRQLREMTLQVTNVEEQLQEKDEQLVNSEEQAREMQEQLTNVQGQLQEKDGRLAEMTLQMRNVEERLREKDGQLTNVQGQLQEKDEETANLQNQVTTLERRQRAKTQEVNELQISLSTAQQLALNERQRQESPDWVISRDQIQLTEKCLGRGGWGSVTEGKYCGCVVAVKQIHDLILSRYNRTLFEREMNIASRCRHPCLLQFIGATNDEGSPLFVTELMETSLRALLEQRPLSTTEVSVISLDVARGLNYLHQKEPSPIIHRDVSSANVLLWRQGEQWRAKVSDYGTANFMRHTMTVAPGAPIYSAPEALTKTQTVKVDVYSFGVLLCEMGIQELPDPERRHEQIAMVTNSVLRALIRGCLQSEPEARPSMEEIIDELEEPA